MLPKLSGLDWNAEVIRVTRHALLMVGMIAASGIAAAQTNFPDAQVEANVLKALAGAPDLANQQITTKTVYGTVTLSGSVTSEAARTQAENLAANSNGVKKVVDELQLGSGTVAAAAQQQGNGMVLMSDGTYGPAPAATTPDQADPKKPAPGSAPASVAQRNNPEADQALDQQMGQQQGTAQGTNAQPGAQAATQQPVQPQYQPQPQTQASAQPYPGRRPMYPPAGYPGYTPYGYPQQPAAGYPQQPAAAYAQQPAAGYAQQGQPPMGGQVAGQSVTVPNGALLRVRINRSLRSDKTQPGTTFDGVVVNDVVADGLVAIPRGASVQGVVVGAKGSGALTGRGEMSIQLTQVTLGGRSYPLVSDLWAHNGGDKTIETVNKTAGFGALGAVVGAVAGGGVGAAIGGGIGAAAGLGSSAASGHGQVFIPAESIVVFHTAQPTQVATVSEQEMQRLAYGVPAGADAPPVRRVYRAYPGYPGYYPPPGYYPYPGNGYPNY